MHRERGATLGVERRATDFKGTGSPGKDKEEHFLTGMDWLETCRGRAYVKHSAFVYTPCVHVKE